MKNSGKTLARRAFWTFASTLIAVISVLTTDTQAKARPGKAHMVGAGTAYPTLNHALFTNPSAVLDSPKTSIQASYFVDGSNVHASALFGQGTWGAGLGYRQFGNTSSLEEVGLAWQLNVLRMGAVLTTVEFGSPDVDASVDFDMNSGRLSVVARQLLDGVSRLDVGLGFLLGKATLGIDIKKPLTTGAEDFWLFDVGLAHQFNKLSVGIGYTFSYDGSSFAGDKVHAGLSFDASNKLAIEAFFNPSRQESFFAGEVVVGARFTL